MEQDSAFADASLLTPVTRCRNSGCRFWHGRIDTLVLGEEQEQEQRQQHHTGLGYDRLCAQDSEERALHCGCQYRSAAARAPVEPSRFEIPLALRLVRLAGLREWITSPRLAGGMLVYYDLPWNLMKVEQRIGRIETDLRDFCRWRAVLRPGDLRDCLTGPEQQLTSISADLTNNRDTFEEADV